MAPTIEKEIKQMHKELEHMIHAQLPELIKILSKELSLPFSNGILRKSGLPPPQQINLNFELSENPSIKGNIVVSSSNVEQMDLIAQMNVFNRKHLFQIFLTNGVKYRLQQLNLAEIYMLKLMDLIDSSINFSQFHDTIKFVDGVINKLKQILDQFKYPRNQFLFPEYYCDPKIITPELPNDLIIQYYIVEGDVMIELIHFKRITESSSSSGFSLANTLKRSNTPPSFYQNQPVEILEKLTIKVNHPKLSQLYSKLKSILEDWTKFNENLYIFDDESF
ncbi:hypothetical protein CONCODRAFT_3208 [Conidiobolus coronatus NRRL 28638]|uniref:Uncharacterized protein n=1 Tax=Conidiobolus coronatus (strain ATCC 28846 / CBS 209.66 / NRRL 28638) TaxID=796925 RepID=A0A137PFL7_CONC2|nr:hypothetical protein CONCODRAFT_3208 [Conidiobolus coronatus NRRL 28638]|eukprot:KXN73799.1 hypothetical protein CONCODRAFT_3208 [Conidiobolus coronatus NRRL 28638]